MKPLLCVLKVREIPQCLESYEAALSIIDQVWICGYKEIEIEALQILDQVVKQAREKGYTHLMMISDDATISNEAVLEVLRITEQHDFATGFCRLDYTSKLVNLSYFQLKDERPRSLADYRLMRYEEIPKGDFQTTFSGFALTCLPIEYWERYPFQCIFNGGDHNGSCSDWMMCVRMGKDHINLWTNRSTEVIHEKIKASTVIGQTFFIGEQYQQIIWRTKK